MAWRNAPALTAILNDANRVAPQRSHASDGTVGDATHAAGKSDHNPDFNGVVHAVDVTNDPAHGMDTWHWAQCVARRMAAGVENRVEYLVSNDGTHDKIFHPSVSLTWRDNNAEGGQSHRNHLHVSIKYTAAAENDTSPFFVAEPGAPTTTPEADMPLNQDDIDKINAGVGNRIIGTLQNNMKGEWIPAIVNGVVAAVNKSLPTAQHVDATAIVDEVAKRLSDG